MFATAPAPRGAVRWLEPAHRRRRRSRLPLAPLAALVLVVAAGAGALLVLHDRRQDEARRQQAATRFVAAWTRGDTAGMWRELSARSRRENPRGAFAGDYRVADRAATVRSASAGRAASPRSGVVRVPVRVRTRLFGALRGTLALPVVLEGDAGRVDWHPGLRLPGLRRNEDVRRKLLRRPRRRSVLAANGARLSASPATAALAGTPPAGDEPGTGLEGFYDRRLRGRPGAELHFGDRLVRRVRPHRGRPVHATIRPAVQQAALDALGGRLGGVAVLRPKDGAVLALAGLAVSAPQPPGSTFKVITLAAALQARVATPSSTYPVRTAATLSPVPLRNASDESCGGSLTTSFAHSCNSVFSPLHARLGAKRLVRDA